ncbi:MAG: transposase [Hespellia sp.]|nr:transposase [Hespellia sp.]
MPRTARKRSISGIYHVIVRGINQQQIFEEKEDYCKFLYTLSDCKKICKFELHAYCLMGNHVHLLIEEHDETISQIMKRISCRFVGWYNRKYERSGHLFQGRFHSEVIETDRAFQIVARYIHRNPVKAKLVATLDEYPWSSYGAYAGQSSSLVDTNKLSNIIGNTKEILSFFALPSDDVCMDIPTQTFISDPHGKKIIFQIAHCRNATEFQALSINLRNRFIKQIKKCGLSIRQISRLCGVSRATIARLAIE